MSRRTIRRALYLGVVVAVLVPGLGAAPAAAASRDDASPADHALFQAGWLYVVQRGDTLSGIARRYGSTVQAIMSANGLSSTTIYIGQRLWVPGVVAPGTSYVVQRGDTLWGIARRFGSTVQAIMTANGLSSTTIYVGQRLIIRGPTAPGTVYIVQRGDTLSGIARRYGTTVQAIMAANGLSSTTIYVGQRLQIPGAGTYPPGRTVYVVQRGDTLWGIARRFGTTVAAIIGANGLPSTTIYVGQRLIIP